MIVEVRSYRIKQGQRERFLEFFQHHAVPAQRAEGIRIVGPFVDLEDPDVFFWLRSFPSMEERDRMKSAFYDGAEWKERLEAIAMPMLEHYDVRVTTIPAGFVNELPAGTGP